MTQQTNPWDDLAALESKIAALDGELNAKRAAFSKLVNEQQAALNQLADDFRQQLKEAVPPEAPATPRPGLIPVWLWQQFNIDQRRWFHVHLNLTLVINLR